MKKLPIKALACALIAAMVLPMAACGKKKGTSREKSRSGEIIKADSPWFDSMVKSYKPEVDSKKTLEYASQQYIGSDDKYFAVYTNGYYKIPSGNIDWNNFSYSDYSINSVEIIDKATGKTEKEYDLAQYLPKNGGLEEVQYENGNFKFRAASYDDMSGKMTVCKYVLDSQTGKVVDKKDTPYEESNYHYYYHTFDFGDYTVKVSQEWDEADKGYCLISIFIRYK